MATSALEIIKPALRKIGAVDALETPSAEQTAVALECLNGIIDSWSATSGTAVNNEEIVITLPPNTTTISIGDGQTINVPRPFRVESAYARVQNIDRNIQIVDKAEYDAVNLKDLATTWPEILWFDGGVPTGNLYFWPRASYGIELHVTVLRYVAAFSSATDTQSLPQGHKRALTLALSVEVAPEFALDPGPSLIRSASTAYKAMVRANYQVPDLQTGVRVQARLGQFLSGGF